MYSPCRSWVQGIKFRLASLVAAIFFYAFFMILPVSGVLLLLFFVISQYSCFSCAVFFKKDRGIIKRTKAIEKKREKLGRGKGEKCNKSRKQAEQLRN